MALDWIIPSTNLFVWAKKRFITGSIFSLFAKCESIATKRQLITTNVSLVFTSSKLYKVQYYDTLTFFLNSEYQSEHKWC